MLANEIFPRSSVGMTNGPAGADEPPRAPPARGTIGNADIEGGRRRPGTADGRERDAMWRRPSEPTSVARPMLC